MTHRTLGLILGPLLFAGILLLTPDSLFASAVHDLVQDAAGVAHLAHSMRVVLALLCLMVVWWLTEAIPLPATALLPPVLLPWFVCYGAGPSGPELITFRSLAENFASPVIFLFLGGFLLAAGMRKWGLDRRLTFWLLTRGKIGGDTHRILLGIMGMTAFLSMWISNTATAALMLPVGLAIVDRADESETKDENFSTAMMLAIAWSASVGGLGTIIGSPPNAIAVGILNATLGESSQYHGLTFLDWMKFGVPYVVLFIPIIWLILLWRFPPAQRMLRGAKEELEREYQALGPSTTAEKRTAGVFLTAVLLWVSNPFWDLLLPAGIAEQLHLVDEYMIGLFAGLLLFVIPAGKGSGRGLLTWEDTRFVDWGVLILFGGGIALSDALFRTGVAAWIAKGVIGLVGVPTLFLLVLVTVLLVDFLTEITSNTAVASMIVPILISIGLATGTDPVTLVLAAALAASMAFMMPVATPPNALVYGSGRVSLNDMMKTGLVLDMIGWPFTIVILWLFGSLIFGVVLFR